MKSTSKKSKGLCCNGFLGPLMLNDDGAAERLQIRQIVPWAAVTTTGIFTCFHATLSFLFLYENIFTSRGVSTHSVMYYFIFCGPIPYLLCWIFGFRLSLASCSACRTQVPLPMWHRLLAAVPVLGMSVLITYAPWLMAITTLTTALPQYIINIIYLQSHKVKFIALSLRTFEYSGHCCFS